MGVHAGPRRLRRDPDRDREVRRQAHLSRHRRVPARSPRHGVARRRQGQARVVRRRRLDLGLAHPDRVVPHPGHRSQAVLQLLRRGHPRRERDGRRERPGRLRDGLRPEPERDDRVGQARQGCDQDRLAVRPAPQRRHRGPQELRPGARQAHPADPARDHRGPGQDHPAQSLHGLRRRHPRELQDDRGRGGPRGAHQGRSDGRGGRGAAGRSAGTTRSRSSRGSPRAGCDSC